MKAQARTCAKGRFIAKRLFEAKHAELELLRPPGGASLHHKTFLNFHIKQAFVYISLKWFSSLLYNAAKAYFLPTVTNIIHGIDKTQSYGGSPGLSPTVQLVLDSRSPSAGTGARNSTILQSNGNFRSCSGLVEGMAAT